MVVCHIPPTVFVSLSLEVHTEWPLPISGLNPIHHDGKISPGWWGWGMHVHPLSPLSLYLPSRSMLQCTLQLRGRIHSPFFISTPNMYTVLLPTATQHFIRYVTSHSSFLSGGWTTSLKPHPGGFWYQKTDYCNRRRQLSGGKGKI